MKKHRRSLPTTENCTRDIAEGNFLVITAIIPSGVTQEEKLRHLEVTLRKKTTFGKNQITPYRGTDTD